MEAYFTDLFTKDERLQEGKVLVPNIRVSCRTMQNLNDFPTSVTS